MARYINVPDHAVWLLAVPIMMLFTGLGQVMTCWLTWAQDYRGLARFRASQPALTSGLQIGLAPICHSSASGLILGGIAGLLTPFGIMPSRLAWLRGGVIADAVGQYSLRQTARQYASFPNYMVPYGLVGVIRERGLIFLLSAFGGTQVVGLYSLALRLLNIPVTLLTTSISPIIHRRAAAESQKANLASVIRKVLLTLVTVATPFFVLMVIGSQTLFLKLLGSRWSQAGLYATIMAAPAYMLLLTGVLDRLMDVVNQQRTAMVIEVTYSAIGIFVALIGLAMFHSVIVAISLFAGVTVLYHAVWIMAVYRLYGFPRRDLVDVFARGALVAIVTGGLVRLGMVVLR